MDESHLRSTHDGCEPEQCSSTGITFHQSRRSTWPKSHWSTRATMTGLPSCPHSPSQYISCRTQTPSMALGAPPPTEETEHSPRSVRTEPSTPALTVTLPLTSPWASLSSNSPGYTQSAQQPFQPTGPKTLDTRGMPSIKWPLVSSENEETGLSKELFQLQWKMNTALAELLEVRASMDHCHRELDVQMELLHAIMTLS